MPCSWELKPQVLVAILTRELVATAWSKGFRELAIPANSTYSFITGMPFDHARNTACQTALDHGFQYLFFLDDDVVPPPNTIHQLISLNLDIVSGLYYRRAMPIHPVALVESKEGPSPVPLSNLEGIQKVDFVGAGCLLIKRHVLEKMHKPWFEWTLDKEIPGRKLSEDFEFCRRAKMHGFDIHVDTRLKCKHIGLASSSHEGYSPIHL